MNTYLYITIWVNSIHISSLLDPFLLSSSSSIRYSVTLLLTEQSVLFNSLFFRSTTSLNANSHQNKEQSKQNNTKNANKGYHPPSKVKMRIYWGGTRLVILRIGISWIHRVLSWNPANPIYTMCTLAI